MKNNHTSNDSESTTLGWKFIAIVAVLTSVFFTFLYLAMSSEPDYMPSQKQKVTNEHKQVTTVPNTEKSSSE
ncbi:hypothetical protein BEN71_11045 [Acinetobacter wuhouensis]|uniref:Uncharacterized protein n=1 Tax=Acinetobacter wuhouensis TaxID=1879050 RepID=A0A385C5U0_9GAMM|nr:MULTISPECIES: hypothetical protein [Acinetobacter]AXQ22576.1 hypothetical protein BEN71_11045 [Acinetobacter wuhouensis]AYO54205.1 hypothetical protein CDG68_11415 [Acinetobacter wuhouensis]RZG76641.1 hypothetical protein EXE09_06305 [Acinetobacter sp. WCHAc060025]RZG88523.1 hypothetical protein EXE10_01600 [Acinetobacter sp. WCHAc060033]